ncbi:class I glutamine amidotransferase-like protein [Melanomma pulvis-pyrius CBS 109.77]|uniref:Class I glutamine amidotransferase-like protein n=1 Tax=Melanomma pulvis-pyrius CBS 109.77 TaxID=1314802 RepID=A0A6A6XU15_9PLEO|nr:class I glutamine amidotransferase-like protein [Melanomma pulvis-pyrius CBS 109.77]
MPSPPRAYTHFPSHADLFYFCTTSSTSEEDLNIHYAPPSKSSLKVGVLVSGTEQVQMLDLAVVDLVAMIGRNRLIQVDASESGLDEAVDEVDIRYVNESGEGSFSVTSGARMPVTNSFADAPQFDILIIPGSFSSAEIPLSVSIFLTTQASNPNLVATMSISSGIQTLVQTGFLHRKRATCPPSLLPSLQERFPETSWQENRWTRHDNVWSSSSAITGIDMVTAWMREYFWDRSEAVKYALAAAGAGLDEYDD